MRIESRRVGSVEIPDDSLIHFPAGLIGLSHRRSFVLLEFDRDVPLGWLQSTEDTDFGLPVADPGLYVPEYAIEVPRAEAAELDLASMDDGVILIVTTIQAGGHMVTGNLRAPLIVNTRNRWGRQIVLDRPDLELRALVDPIAFSRACAPTDGSEARPSPAVTASP